MVIFTSKPKLLKIFKVEKMYQQCYCFLPKGPPAKNCCVTTGCTAVEWRDQIVKNNKTGWSPLLLENYDLATNIFEEQI